MHCKLPIQNSCSCFPCTALGWNPGACGEAVGHGNPSCQLKFRLKSVYFVRALQNPAPGYEREGAAG